MAKVPEVLVDASPNFRGCYKGQNGKELPMYRFPKREACLMAMSYSYDLQAKVLDTVNARLLHEFLEVGKDRQA